MPPEESDCGVSGVRTFSATVARGLAAASSGGAGACPAVRACPCRFAADSDLVRACFPPLPDGVGVVRPSGTCSRRATCCACAAWPDEMLFTTSGRMSAHICSALIEPHSMILLFSQSSDTGFVRKSLQPAASAATRSACSDDAVSATMMTDDRYAGVTTLRVSDVDVSDGVRCPSDCGVVGKPPAPFCFSIRLISLVA